MIDPGDAAKQYLYEHGDDIHPATGRPPIVLTELQSALNEGKHSIADQLAHNYSAHGVLEAGTSLCVPACRGEAEI